MLINSESRRNFAVRLSAWCIPLRRRRVVRESISYLLQIQIDRREPPAANMGIAAGNLPNCSKVVFAE
jgi:hypothetical protein